MTDPQKLLEEYAETGSEAAFTQVVECYINLVYSVALRQMSGDAHAAQDVTQTVFTDLARQAGKIPADVQLGGWLHRHCSFVASHARRADARRLAREQQAVAMETLHASEPKWSQLAPILDDAIGQLGEEDRIAVILRFFERKDFQAIGESIGASENAAQKRVARAVDKLRGFLAQEGVVLSAVALASMLANESMAAAPPHLSSAVSKLAIRQSGTPLAAALGSGFALAAFWKNAALIAAALILAAALYSSSRYQNPPASISARNKNQAEANQPVAPVAVPAPGEAALPTKASDSTRTKDEASIEVTILAGDSGRPIPNVPVDLREVVETKAATRTLSSLRNGILLATYSLRATELSLITRIDGFADTRLQWHPERGDQIPKTYVLRKR